jgi:transposase
VFLRISPTAAISNSPPRGCAEGPFARPALKKTICDCCGRVQTGWYDRRVRQVRDLPSAGFRIVLELEVRRVACRRCGAVKRERLDFLADNPHYTKRFAFYVAAAAGRQRSDRHWDRIAAYCRPENKVSLGFVEGLNNKIRVIQRRAYGLRDQEYLRLKVLT